jgi:hypothetical protein
MIKMNCEWMRNWYKKTLVGMFLWNPKPFIPQWKNKDFLVVYIAGSWRVINEPKQSGFGLKPHVLLLGSGE